MTCLICNKEIKNRCICCADCYLEGGWHNTAFTPYNKIYEEYKDDMIEIIVYSRLSNTAVIGKGRVKECRHLWSLDARNSKTGGILYYRYRNNAITNNTRYTGNTNRCVICNSNTELRGNFICDRCRYSMKWLQCRYRPNMEKYVEVILCNRIRLKGIASRFNWKGTYNIHDKVLLYRYIETLPTDINTLEIYIPEIKPEELPI